MQVKDIVYVADKYREKHLFAKDSVFALWNFAEQSF